VVQIVASLYTCQHSCGTLIHQRTGRTFTIRNFPSSLAPSNFIFGLFWETSNASEIRISRRDRSGSRQILMYTSNEDLKKAFLNSLNFFLCCNWGYLNRFDINRPGQNTRVMIKIQDPVHDFSRFDMPPPDCLERRGLATTIPFGLKQD
jgi:hypothetical protein